MNKHILSLTLLLLTLSLPLTAGEKISKVLKASGKAVCSIATYNDGGEIVAIGQGFFVGENKVYTAYDLFKGATNGVAVDAAGVSHKLLKVKGAHELYNVIRLSVETDRKRISLTADSLVASVGERLYLPPLSTASKEKGEFFTVSEVTPVGGYSYYTLSGPVSPLLNGRPLLTEDGRLAAICQPASEGDTLCYALDTRYVESLSLRALALNEPSYRQLLFPKALPDDVSQAQVYLFLAESQTDRTSYHQTVESFIEQFPDVYDGYLQRFKLDVEDSLYDRADEDVARALELAEKKGEVHYQTARAIFRTLAADTTFTREGWTMERVTDELRAAITCDSLAVYYKELADVYAYNGQYRQAVLVLIQQEQLPGFRGTEDFYYYREQLERQCRMFQQAIDDIDRCITLRPTQAAYRLEKAILHLRVGQVDVAKPILEELLLDYPDDPTCRSLYDTYCTQK